MIFTLYKTFFYVGVVTFGGGYGMIPIVKETCVDRHKWISSEEFLNIVAIAESTPGPIAVNLATYVGYKKNKIIGSIFATLGVLTPSFVIIYILSFFLKNVLNNVIVNYAFQGIRIAVVIAIFRTALNLIHTEYKNSTNKNITITIFFLYLVLALLISFFDLNISTIFLIISSIVLGILFYICKKKDKK